VRLIKPKPAPSEDADSLDTAHIAVRTMFRKGEISEEAYFKVVVHLAYNWMVMLERKEDAKSLLCELTPDYVQYVLPRQMSEDSNFKREALALARAVSNGLPDMDDDDVQMVLMLLDRPVAKA